MSWSVGVPLVCIILISVGGVLHDVREQRNYLHIISHRDDDPLGVMTDMQDIDSVSWSRNELQSHYLAQKLSGGDEEENKELFDAICQKNTYHVLQVCGRWYYSQNDWAALKKIITTALVRFPQDPIFVSLAVEISSHEGDNEISKILFQQLLDSFPPFIFADDLHITSYQKAKKEKILNHFPIEYWLKQASK